jgi:outer membrane lipoprotein-sorting protein
MMTAMKTFMLSAVTLLWLAPAAADGPPSPQEIMEKNFFASKWHAVRYESVMILINERGQKRERRSTNVVALQENGIDSRFLVKFTAPSDIRGTGFLQLEHSEADDDLWIYLPALKKSRRLVANNKKDSFFGSDFAYGDILLPKVALYRHTLLKSEPIDGHDCFVVESAPTSDTVKANSGYGKRVTWVRKDTFLESKVEYYDLGGRLLKTQLIKQHQQVEPDPPRWFGLHREMTNHQTGHKTELRFSNLQSGVDAPAAMFTTRHLERE